MNEFQSPDGQSDQQKLADAVVHELEQVIDPELGVPITDVGLVDQVDIVGNDVKVSFHLTMPFCPDHFVVMMAEDILNRLDRLPGIGETEVEVLNHVNSEPINLMLKERRHPGRAA